MEGSRVSFSTAGAFPWLQNSLEAISELLQTGETPSSNCGDGSFSYPMQDFAHVQKEFTPDDFNSAYSKDCDDRCITERSPDTCERISQRHLASWNEVHNPFYGLSWYQLFPNPPHPVAEQCRKLGKAASKVVKQLGLVAHNMQKHVGWTGSEEKPRLVLRRPEVGFLEHGLSALSARYLVDRERTAYGCELYLDPETVLHLVKGVRCHLLPEKRRQAHDTILDEIEQKLRVLRTRGIQQLIYQRVEPEKYTLTIGAEPAEGSLRIGSKIVPVPTASYAEVLALLEELASTFAEMDLSGRDRRLENDPGFLCKLAAGTPAKSDRKLAEEWSVKYNTFRDLEKEPLQEYDDLEQSVMGRCRQLFTMMARIVDRLSIRSHNRQLWKADGCNRDELLDKKPVDKLGEFMRRLAGWYSFDGRGCQIRVVPADLGGFLATIREELFDGTLPAIAARALRDLSWWIGRIAYSSNDDRGYLLTYAATSETKVELIGNRG